MKAAKDSDEIRNARPGTVLMGKWRIVRPLAKGGMSTVYEAVHRNGRRVAVKVLHPTLAADARARSRFLRESSLANRVNHPNVVAIIDEDETADGTVFLVMELLTGETLEERWTRQGRILPVHEALSIAGAILEPLSAVHRVGIVHRDLKPSNVFLCASGIKLLDFGVARLREANSTDSAITRSGSMLGTPAFMAPEQARGRWDDVDERTDIWAVGAILFSLLSGRFVHEGSTPNELLIASATQPAISLSTVAPNVPTTVAEFVDRALRLDRQDRWPDAATMLLALRTLRADTAQVEGTRHESIPDRPDPTTVPDDSASGYDSGDGPVSRNLVVRLRLPAMIGLASTAALSLAGGTWLVRRGLSVGVDAHSSPTHTSAMVATSGSAGGRNEDVARQSGDLPFFANPSVNTDLTPMSSNSSTTNPPAARRSRNEVPRGPGIAAHRAPQVSSGEVRTDAGAQPIHGTFSGIPVEDDALDQHK